MASSPIQNVPSPRRSTVLGACARLMALLAALAAPVFAVTLASAAGHPGNGRIATAASLVVHDLVVDVAGTGTGTVVSEPAGIDCGASCSASFLEGTTVLLTATPAADSHFAGWTGDCAGTGDCIVPMDADRSVKATFEAGATQVPSVVFSFDSPTVACGLPAPWTATVSGSAGTPTGDVALRTLLGFPLNYYSLVGGVATGSIDVSAYVGTVSLLVTYPGNGVYTYGNSDVGSVTFIKATPAVTLTSGNNPAAPGSLVTLTATVVPVGTCGIPEGSVLFRVDGIALGSAALDASGMALMTTPIFTAGPYNVTAEYSGGDFYEAANADTLVQTVGAANPARSDFNADGKSDLLWQNADGRVAVWLMNGLAPSATSEILAGGTGWSVVQIADFDGDGKADLLWQHPDGRAAIWLMNGATPSATQQVLNAGSGWSAVATADLDGDGKADIVWQHTDGTTAVWLMNGTTASSGSSIMGPGTGWSVTHTGDFDHDGKADLVWTHTDGRVAIWLMNGLTPTATNQILNAGSGWSVTHVADLDGDGKADLVWQHTDGRAAVWLMNGAAMSTGSEILGAGSGWSVAHAADFDGDGKADLLWQHGDGRAAIWLMNGLTPSVTNQILNAGGGWSAKRTGDLNGDGKADIVWENVDGSVAVWFMNGAAMSRRRRHPRRGYRMERQPVRNSMRALRSGLIRSALLAGGLAIGSPFAAAQFVPTSVSTGSEHTCAVTTGGGAKCWGNNFNGQLGDNSNDNQFTPVDVTGLTSGVVAVAAGDFHTCALTTGGGVKCWGKNFNGQVGDGTSSFFENRLTPVDVVGLASGVAAIAAGGSHTCALTASGGVKCWGANSFGQQGSNGGGDHLEPVDVVGLTSGVVAIAAGGSHTCALTTSGGVKCWGWSFYGQVGDGGTTNRSTPVDVFGLTSGMKAIATGTNHACALTTGGGVKCWGRNSQGQAGDGTSGNNRLTPVSVSGLASGMVGIAAGFGHTCAVSTGGGVKCWGSNSNGQVGDGASFDIHSTPSDVAGLAAGVASIAAGGNHACALTGEGALKCWGDGGAGGLGDGMGGAVVYMPVRVFGQAIGVAAIEADSNQTCVVTIDGGAKCWGWNSAGELGDGTQFQRNAPVDVSGLASGVAAIAPGETFTCALTAAGGVKCWGLNSLGALGDGYSFTERYTPGDVAGLESGVVAVTAGQMHACALTTSGGVKCWGGNNYGQLGDDSLTSRFTAMDVPGLTSGIAAISAGGAHTCVLTTVGGVKCWGNNSLGALGDNSATDRHTPVDVVGLASGVAAIVAGGNHTCALTTAGGVKCWGWNQYGQVGDNSKLNNRLVPVDVFQLASGVEQIAVGDTHACALTTGGAMKCWGSDFAGEAGDGTFGTDHIVPTPVTGLASGVAAIAAGGLHTCALMERGGVKCWGWNARGLVGDNTTANKYVPADVAGLGSAQSIAFAPVATAGTSAAFNVSASATSGLAVAFDTWTPATCTVSGGTVTPIASGLCGVRASQPGDSGNFAAPQQLRLIAISSGGAPVASVRTDFDGDGKSDLLWQNADGRVALWLMNGLAPSATSEILAGGTGFVVAQMADFDGDGKADLLWQHPDGRAAIWLMNGSTPSATQQVLNAGSGWSAVATADLDGDGKADIVWQHSDGTTAVWLMNGTTASSGSSIMGPGTGWSVTHTGDFDHDGKADLVWTHTDGRVAIWLMNGLTPTATNQILNAGSGWSVTHVADLDGDGKSDLVWQHTDGRAAVWLMNGAAMSTGSEILGAGSGWSVAHAADFDGDGKADLLWQHGDGRAAIWLMNGLTPSVTNQILNAGGGWSAKRTGDLNGDGKADIVWENVDGSVAVWFMNGAAMSGGGGILGTGTGWSVSGAGR